MHYTYFRVWGCLISLAVAFFVIRRRKDGVYFLFQIKEVVVFIF